MTVLIDSYLLVSSQSLFAPTNVEKTCCVLSPPGSIAPVLRNSEKQEKIKMIDCIF